MVEIRFNKKKPQILEIYDEFRDKYEQILISSSIFLIMLIIIVVTRIQTGEVPRFFFAYLIIFFLIDIYFLFPSSRLRINFPDNKWQIAKLIFIIPRKIIIGKISDISMFVLDEEVDHVGKKTRFQLSPQKIKYTSELEIWGFLIAGEREKHSIFHHTTYNFSSHNRVMIENNRIGVIIEEILKKLKIPIEFEVNRETIR